MTGDADLLEVVGALSAAGRFASRLHGGKKQRDEYGDDGDDHQQFDQGETGSSSPHVSSFQGKETLKEMTKNDSDSIT